MAHDQRDNPMTPLTYTYNAEQNIHTFVIHQASRAAVDAYIRKLEEIVESFGEIQPKSMYLLLDFTEDGLYPMAYLNKQLAGYIRKFPRIPTNYLAYIVTHPGDQTLVKALQYSSNVYRETTREIFDSREKAVDWLLSKT